MSEVVLIEKIISVIDNKYEAIRVIAKEARRINSVLMRSEGEVDEKPTMMALQRVLDHKIKFEYGELEKKGPLFNDDSE
jgi:DNA-directed RNA polymerase subunit K/omega